MMNTPKHTPGPWCVRHDDMVCSQEGRIIADCESTPYAMRPAPPIVEDKANATLIAAAPAMYEALKECLASLEVAQRFEGDVFGIHHNDTMDAMYKAEAALAQAEGRG